MTDTNETIARWMGWQWDYDQKCWLAPEEDELGERFANPIPNYTRSLDAQVPVWEALEKALAEEIEVAFTISPARPEATINAGYNVWSKQADTPAEASANAIVAAIKAMGEAG